MTVIAGAWTMVRAFILTLVCAVGSVAPARATSMTFGEIWSIDVVDEQHGCFNSRRDVLRFVVDGGVLRSERSTLPLNEAYALREQIVGSEMALDLAVFGIDADAARRHRDDIVRAVVPTGMSLPTAFEPLLAWEHVKPLLRARFLASTRSLTDSERFKVTFHGPGTVFVESGEGPGMLPWQITIGDRRFESWSPAVTRALRRLLVDAPPDHPLHRADDWWSSGIWRDEGVWQPLRRRVEATLAHDIVEHLEDHALAQDWTVERASLVHGDLELALRRRSRRTNHIVTDVRWRVQLVAGLPTSGWSALSTVLRHTDDVLRPHRWMSTWLDAKPGREVELTVVGAAVESPLLFDSVGRRWIDGGFNGGPELQVILRDGDRAVDVWVAERERRALITWMSEHDARGGDSWLDRASMGDAPCLKVDADGAYRRCLR